MKDSKSLLNLLIGPLPVSFDSSATCDVMDDLAIGGRDGEHFVKPQACCLVRKHYKNFVWPKLLDTMQRQENVC